MHKYALKLTKLLKGFKKYSTNYYPKKGGLCIKI